MLHVRLISDSTWSLGMSVWKCQWMCVYVTHPGCLTLPSSQAPADPCDPWDLLMEQVREEDDGMNVSAESQKKNNTASKCSTVPHSKLYDSWNSPPVLLLIVFRSTGSSHKHIVLTTDITTLNVAYTHFGWAKFQNMLYNLFITYTYIYFFIF